MSAPNSRLPDSRARYTVWALLQLTALYFPITFFWSATLSQLLPARIETLAGNEKGVAMALIGGGGAVAATVCMLIVGPLSDNTRHRYGRRFPWVFYGVLLGAAGALGFALAPTLFWLLLAFVAARLGLAAVIAGYEAILPDRLSPQQHARAASFGECFDLLGQFAGLAATLLLVQGALGQLLGRSIAPDDESWLAKLLICALAAVLLLIVFTVSLPWLRENTDEKTRAARESQMRAWREVLPRVFRFSLASAPDFASLYIARCVLNIGTLTAVHFIRYFVDETAIAGVDVAGEVVKIGIALTIGGVVGALCAGVIGDRISKRTLLSVFCALCSFTAIGFVFENSLEDARGWAFAFGIGFSAINTLSWSWATTLVPRGREARYLGAFQSSFLLPQIYVFGIGGLIGHQFGYRALFCTIPVYLLLGAALLFKVHEPRFAR